MLPEEVGAKNFEFYGTKLSGATEQRDRWKRAVGLAESLVGEEIGQVFVDKHFPASSKREMDELVDYLIAAYRERISQLEWMTPATRERALEKLSQFKAKIGFPDSWRDYSGLEVSGQGADLLANARAGSAFSHDFELAKIGKPADRDEWVTTPQTVNAFITRWSMTSPSRPPSCARRFITQRPMPQKTSAPSVPSSATRLVMALMIRARSLTARAT